MELLVLGLVATIGFASYALWSKASAPDEAARTDERTPSTLQVGDVVQHLGTDYVVEGALTFAEDDAGAAPGARLYRLVDGARERYLFVASAEPLLVDETALDGAPSDALEHDRRHFRIRETVQATALRAGSVGPRRLGGRVTLRTYAAGAETRLIVLVWQDHVDAFVGERVAPHLLDLLPGK